MKNRIVVVESMYFQSAEAQPTSQESRFARWATSSEQPYTRVTDAKAEWVPLDYGWVETACMVCVKCFSGKLELGVNGAAFAEVRKGESARFTPVGRPQVRGEGRYSVTVYSE